MSQYLGILTRGQFCFVDQPCGYLMKTRLLNSRLSDRSTCSTSTRCYRTRFRLSTSKHFGTLWTLELTGVRPIKSSAATRELSRFRLYHTWLNYELVHGLDRGKKTTTAGELYNTENHTSICGLIRDETVTMETRDTVM